MSRMVAVLSIEEEWRTPRKTGSHGRVCLWLRKVCGHYPEQRMATLDRDGNYTAPKRVRCQECS